VTLDARSDGADEHRTAATETAFHLASFQLAFHFQTSG